MILCLCLSFRYLYFFVFFLALDRLFERIFWTEILQKQFLETFQLFGTAWNILGLDFWIFGFDLWRYLNLNFCQLFSRLPCTPKQSICSNRVVNQIMELTCILNHLFDIIWLVLYFIDYATNLLRIQITFLIRQGTQDRFFEFVTLVDLLFNTW